MNCHAMGAVSNQRISFFASALADLRKDYLKPPPKMNVVQWADTHRVLSAESSSTKSKWHTNRVEVARQPMLDFTDPLVHMITVVACTQLMKTSFLENIIGYTMDQEPQSMLLIQPTVEAAQNFSKERIAPMIRDNACLTDKVNDPRTRDSGNTLLMKMFPGGFLALAGSNSPTTLASRPLPIVLCDEVDKYPESAGGEGDPISLAIERTATYSNWKVVQVCSPTVEKKSRIWKSWEESDQRLFYVPCVHCDHWQHLTWENVHWQKDEDGIHLPDTATIVCAECGSLWSEADRLNALKQATPRAQKPFNGHTGYHISKLYSPWQAIPALVKKFLAAKGDPVRMQAFWNTQMAELWREETGATIEAGPLYDRREGYDKAPLGVGIISAGVDTQDDRLECQIIGWGVGLESWVISNTVIWGNPAESAVWDALDDVLLAGVKSEHGVTLPVSVTCVDSAGHHTQDVYKYTKARQHQKVYSIRGANSAGKPIAPKKYSIVGGNQTRMYLVGTDTGKQWIYSRLKKENEGAGYVHFPTSLEPDYFDQLTSEHFIERKKLGRSVWRWETKPGRKRNEAIDTFNYALAGVFITKLDTWTDARWERWFNALSGKYSKSAIEEKPPPTSVSANPQSGGGFINNNFTLE